MRCSWLSSACRPSWPGPEVPRHLDHVFPPITAPVTIFCRLVLIFREWRPDPAWPAVPVRGKIGIQPTRELDFLVVEIRGLHHLEPVRREGVVKRTSVPERQAAVDEGCELNRDHHGDVTRQLAARLARVGYHQSDQRTESEIHARLPVPPRAGRRRDTSPASGTTRSTGNRTPGSARGRCPAGGCRKALGRRLIRKMLLSSTDRFRDLRHFLEGWCRPEWRAAP